jgi:Arc/MetJ-type ribon-helix-helix transcriptional regulator
MQLGRYLWGFACGGSRLSLPSRTVLGKSRLSLEIPKQTRDQIDDIVKRSGASSLTEVIRRALALYDLVLEHKAENGTLVLRHKDGREEVLRLI